jgi:deoxyribodipyrimidine photo-lyase
MSRDQRTEDNWALLYAQKRATVARVPLVVVFTLAPGFLGATMRHYSFMLRGLEEVEADLLRKNIGFVLLEGDPVRQLPGFLESSGAGILVTDFDPLKIKVQWRAAVAATCQVRVF